MQPKERLLGMSLLLLSSDKTPTTVYVSVVLVIDSPEIRLLRSLISGVYESSTTETQTRTAG